MNNLIHPTAIIQGDVQIGDGNEIGAYTIILGPVTIGNRNRIGPHVTIGTPGQDTRNPIYDDSQSMISIGNDCIIREYTAIQKPCYSPLTQLGNRVFLMQSVHIPHDADIRDDVVITPMVALGGISKVLQGANLALGVTVHQYSVIGHYSIAAMGAAVTKNIKPFARYIPNQPLSVNTYAVQKFGFDDVADQIEAYVLRGDRPTSPRLLGIVEEFEAMHQASGRACY